MTPQFIIEFVVAIAILILAHEFGHFIVCRLCKVPVEEFGIGLPPRLFRFWRGKGSLKVGNHRIVIPHNFKLPFDPKEAQGRPVDVLAIPVKDKLILKSIAFAALEDGQYRPTSSEPVRTEAGELRLEGTLNETIPGTEYTINWLPLGGFVRPKGETDFNVRDGLAAARPLARTAVAGAGPLMNLVLAVIFYSVSIFSVGKADPARLDVVEVQGVMRNSPSEAAGLQLGDIILSMDGEAMTSGTQATDYIYDHLDQPIVIEVQRGTEIVQVTVTPLSSRVEENQGPTGTLLGAPSIPVSVPEAAWLGLRATGEHIDALFTLVGDLIAGRGPEGAVELMGPIGMGGLYVDQRQESPTSGAYQLFDALFFFINLTISLAFLNLLPIPALDGGRILMAGFELIFRRRLPAKAENWLVYISFMLLLLLLLYVTFRDVVGLIFG